MWSLNRATIMAREMDEPSRSCWAEVMARRLYRVVGQKRLPARGTRGREAGVTSNLFLEFYRITFGSSIWNSVSENSCRCAVVGGRLSVPLFRCLCLTVRAGEATDPAERRDA